MQINKLPAVIIFLKTNGLPRYKGAEQIVN